MNLMHPAPVAKSFEDYPLFLTIDHMVEIYGRTRGWIERIVREGRKEIPPPASTHPMRWSRKDVERQWAGRTA